MDMVASHPDAAFPRFHPRPAAGWISDPCGLSYVGGRYHVFFQFNPESARHHAICWGHLSSPDLLRWVEEPVALRPQPGGPDALGCWTGVVTDDGGVPVAAYSGGVEQGGRSPVVLASAVEALTTWRQDGHVAAAAPREPQLAEVRDPYIFRFQGRRFAIQGAGLASGHAAVLLYSVDDIRAWKYEGIWLTSRNEAAARHLPAGIWECPQLVRVPDSSGAETWLLMASLRLSSDPQMPDQPAADPQTPAGHPGGAGYLLGALAADASTGLPVYVPGTGGKADLGPDFYAPQILSLPDRALLWGWSAEARSSAERDGRSQQAIDDAGWAGVLTFPRRLMVHGGVLAVEPAAELTALRGRPLFKCAAGTLHLPAHAEAAATGGEGGLRLVLASSKQRRTVFADTVAGGGRAPDLRRFLGRGGLPPRIRGRDRARIPGGRGGVAARVAPWRGGRRLGTPASGQRQVGTTRARPA